MAVPNAKYPPLIIVAGKYGKTPAKTADVTDKLRALQKTCEGGLTIEAKTDFNKIFGDPEPGASKKLLLTYQYGADGDVFTDEFEESHPLIEYTAQDKPTDRMIGKLTLTVHRAADLVNVNTISKMDPYVVCKVGGEEFKSKVAEDAHTNPKWDISFLFNLDGKNDILHVTVYSKGTISDTVIGTANLAVGVLSALGKDVPSWQTLNSADNFNKKTGTIMLSAVWKGRGGPRPAVVATQHVAAAPIVVVVPAGVDPTAVKSADGSAVAPALTAPNCSKNHPMSQYTGKKPQGYVNQFGCDYCSKQKNFGPAVTFWHCDVCTNWDCCDSCAQKFIGEAHRGPAFVKAKCGKCKAALTRGWNTFPPFVATNKFTCVGCSTQSPHAPAVDYYFCAACKQCTCGACAAKGTTSTATAGAPASAAAAAAAAAASSSSSAKTSVKGKN